MSDRMKRTKRRLSTEQSSQYRAQSRVMLHDIGVRNSMEDMRAAQDRMRIRSEAELLAIDSNVSRLRVQLAIALLSLSVGGAIGTYLL